MCTENAKCEKTFLRHIWQDYVEMAEHIRFSVLLTRKKLLWLNCLSRFFCTLNGNRPCDRRRGGSRF